MTERSSTVAKRYPARAPSTVRIGDDDVLFRESRPGDETQIAEVFAAAFGGFYPSDKPVDEVDYIRWFTEQRDSRRGVVTLAEIEGRIASVISEIHQDIRLGEQTLHGIVGGIGTATHPDFQGRGIIKAMSKWTHDIWNPASLDTRSERLRNTRTSSVPCAGNMCAYLYVQRPLRAASARKAGSAALSTLPVAAMVLWSRLRSRIRPKRAKDVTVRTIPVFDERF